jgi:hypothetical protein
VDEVSICLEKYSENEKKSIKIYRIHVNRWSCNNNDKFHLLFYWMDINLRNNYGSYITFENFEILVKNYIKNFLNKTDKEKFLKIFNNEYFCCLYTRKNLFDDEKLLKLNKNINFLTLLYDKYEEEILFEYNTGNVIDFLIENEQLFILNTEQSQNILNEFKEPKLQQETKVEKKEESNINTITKMLNNFNIS